MKYRADSEQNEASRQLLNAYANSLETLEKKSTTEGDAVIGMVIAISFNDVDYAERFVDAAVNLVDRAYGNANDRALAIQKATESAKINYGYTWRNLRQIPQFETTRRDLVGSAIKNNNPKMFQMLVKKGMMIRELNVLADNFSANKKIRTEMLKSLFGNVEFIRKLKENLDVTLIFLAKEQEIRELFKNACPDAFLGSLVKACENDPAAQLFVAQEFERKNNPASAISWYKKSANNGNAEAQRKIGECYLNGELNCGKNMDIALDWFEKAARQNDEIAKTKLKTLPPRERIIGANYGNADDQYELAQWFFKNRDYKSAREWFLKAADGGNVAAMKFLGEEFLKSRGAFELNEEVGITLLKSASARGNAEAKRILGNYFLRVNAFDKGIELLLEAKNCGDRGAQLRIDFLTNVKPNEKVKNENYVALMGEDSLNYAFAGTKPVTDISCEEADEFCRRLTIISQKTDKIRKSQAFHLEKTIYLNDEIGGAGFSVILVDNNVPAGTPEKSGKSKKSGKNVVKKSSSHENSVPANNKSRSRAVLNLCDSLVAVENFQISKYEVAQADFEAIAGTNPSKFKGENLPVENISAKDAVAFCKRLTTLARAAGTIGKREEFRLPTTDEWETACRAGKDIYPSYVSKNNLQAIAWFEGSFSAGTHPIGMKKPNEFGIYDMYGNVWEFCYDKARANFVRKGGGFSSREKVCEASYSEPAPTKTFYDTGFRVVLAPVK